MCTRSTKPGAFFSQSFVCLAVFSGHISCTKTSTVSKPNRSHFRFSSHSGALLLCEDKNNMSHLLISCLLCIWLVLYRWGVGGNMWLFQTTIHTPIQIPFSHASCSLVTYLFVVGTKIQISAVCWALCIRQPWSPSSEIFAKQNWPKKNSK